VVSAGANGTMEGKRSLYDRIETAARAVEGTIRDCSKRWTGPRFGVVLGTGLGGFDREIDVSARIPYTDVPGFPPLRAVSHEGAFTIGSVAGRGVLLLEGRYHLYEGYSLEDVTFPVRLLKKLGVDLAVFSNAAGGLDPDGRAGDIMLIDDHLNLTGANPLVGPNDDRLGPRFPDMCRPYDPKALEIAEAIAREEGIRARRGVYAALLGPCLETRAEYRYLRTIGADAVGMSTVPEVIVAVHAGLRSFGISCITDRCIPEELKPVNIGEILRVAAEAEPKMRRLVRRLIERY
jgi:purine-nucleoside phosphorylase